MLRSILFRYSAYFWLAVCALGLVAIAGCQPLKVGNGNIASHLRPSNDRNWTADMRVLPNVQLDGDQLTIRNIRNCQYVTENDYIVDHYDRTIRVDEIRSVDFLVVPFKNTPAIAHTMLSFGLVDDSVLCVSAEIRKEIGEKYTTMAGMANQFELIYLVADEKDLIRLRTHHRDADVYVYPTTATAEQSQRLFLDVAQRINKLQMKPEFYNTLTNNCTTSIQRHVNDLSENRIPFGWQVLLPGHSAKYAYDLGLLDNNLEFDELTRLALVNDLSDKYYDAPDFSKQIRQRHQTIARKSSEQATEQR